MDKKVHLTGKSTRSGFFFLKNALVTRIPNAPEHEVRNVVVSGIVNCPKFQKLYDGAIRDRHLEMIDVPQSCKNKFCKRTIHK